MRQERAPWPRGPPGNRKVLDSSQRAPPFRAAFSSFGQSPPEKSRRETIDRLHAKGLSHATSGPHRLSVLPGRGRRRHLGGGLAAVSGAGGPGDQRRKRAADRMV